MSTQEATMEISVYGGKKSDVKESIERNLELTDESFYQTWLSINVMKQLAFLIQFPQWFRSILQS